MRIYVGKFQTKNILNFHDLYQFIDFDTFEKTNVLGTQNSNLYVKYTKYIFCERLGNCIHMEVNSQFS